LQDKELTQDEKQFIKDILSRVQVQPLDPQAIIAINMIQSIVKKLEE